MTTYPPLVTETDEDAVKIGRHVEKIAKDKNNNQKEKDAKEFIKQNTKRKGTGDKINKVDLEYEVDKDKKKVIVPDELIIRHTLSNLPTDFYGLSLQYHHQSAKKFIKDADTAVAQEEEQSSGQLTEEQKDKVLADIVRAYATHGDALSIEDFFYMRLGEYCINQCR